MLSLSFGNQKDEWCRWPLPILIPASQPVQHHKRVLWKGTNSAPIPDYFYLSSIVGTCLATHLPFLHYSLASSFSFPGSACVLQSIHTLDELIHSLAFFFQSPLCLLLLAIIDPLLCKSRWMNWFIALKKSFPFSLLWHQSLVSLWFCQLVLPLLTDLFVNLSCWWWGVHAGSAVE